MYTFSTNIIILIFLMLFLWKNYGRKALAHPGLWFSILWILCIICFLLTIKASYYGEYFPEKVVLLNKEIFFTSVGFVLFSFLSKLSRPKNPSLPHFQLERYYRIYPFLALICLLGGVGMWLDSGGSLNIVVNRAAMIENNEILLNSAQRSIVSGILYKFYLLHIPCSIFAGYMLARSVQKKSIPYSKCGKIFLFLPFLATVFATVSIGGRRGFVTIVMYYGIGFILKFVCTIDYDRIKIIKIAAYCALYIIGFSVFSTFVREIRTEAQTGHDYSFDCFSRNYKFLSPFSGIIVYLADPFVGFQYKTKYALDHDLSYGNNTFNGLNGFSLPLLDRLSGVNINLGAALGFEKISGAKWMYENIPMAVTVSSIYYNIVNDFGENGSIVVVLLLTFVSQYVYDSFFCNKKLIIKFLNLYLIVIFLMFWMNSIFSGFFASSTPSEILYVFIFWECFRHFSKHQKYDFSFGLYRKQIGVA